MATERFPAWMKPVLVLHFFRAEGCPYCEEAAPYVDSLRKKFPLRILVVPHNVTRDPSSEVMGWKPEGTPGYALTAQRELLKAKSGLMTQRELEVWIGKELLS